MRSDVFGFVFQSFHLLDGRPAIESVHLGLMYRGMSTQARSRIASQAMERVGIGHLAQRPARLLSGGERQRVAVARALAADAPVLLADEPTGNLDSKNALQFVEILKEVNREGTTVVIVTHSQEVASQAPRRVKLKDGRIHLDSRRVGPQNPPAQHRENRAGHGAVLRKTDLFFDALASLNEKRRRTVAVFCAVAAGAGLAVATFGLSATAGAQVSEAFDARANRDVTVKWSIDRDTVDDEGPEVDSSIAAARRLNGVDSAGVLADFGGVGVSVSRVREPVTTRMYAISPGLLAASRAQVDWASDTVDLRGDQVLLGENLARQLDLAPIDLGPTVTLDGTSRTVVGLVSSSPRQPEMMASVVTLLKDSEVADAESISVMLLTTPGAAQQVATEAPLAIDPFNPESLEVTAPVDPRDLRAEIEASVATMLMVMTGVAILGGFVGLSTAMMLSVGERTREFGLRRAVGARRRDIAGLVTMESALLGLGGSVAGLVLGLLANFIIAAMKGWIPVFDFAVAPLTVVGGALLGVAGGVLASRRAMQVEPHAALRAI